MIEHRTFRTPPWARASSSPRPTPCGIPVVLVTTGGTQLAGGLASKGPHVLDPRARNRADRLRSADALASRATRRQVTAVRTRALKAASVVDTHRFLSLLALGAIGLHGLALTLDQTVRIGLSSLLVPGLSGYRPLATGLGVVAAELAGLVIVSFPSAQAHWTSYVAEAALGDLRRVRTRDRARPRRRYRLFAAMGLQPLPGRRLRGGYGHCMARPHPTDSTERSKPCTRF